MRMVFTGIIEEMGVVESIENLDSEEGGVKLTVKAEVTLAEVGIGDSISVNGTCLTVTHLSPTTFTFGLAPETLRRANLSGFNLGTSVNLERSMSAGGRYGGHIVQGHVDCTGSITKVSREKDALWFTVSIPQPYMRYVVEKGYVTVDGASLTVCNVIDEENSFTFMLVPQTQANVVTAKKEKGDMVNVEVDITGKYIDRILEARLKVSQAPIN